MTYNVFGGTLSLTQSINQLITAGLSRARGGDLDDVSLGLLSSICARLNNVRILGSSFGLECHGH